jgi:epoxyqueuosine reductase
LIVPGWGSYVVLAEIVCNLDLACGQPLASGCGDCDLCVRACPTGALGKDGLVDARRCLSYLSIDHAGPIDRAAWPAWGERLFGCDACQQACPHNRQLPAGEAELTGCNQAAPAGATLEQVLAWQESDWDAATRGSALRRAKLATFQRNAILAAGAARRAGLGPAMERLRSGRADLAEMIDWALGRYQGGPVR